MTVWGVSVEISRNGQEPIDRGKERERRARRGRLDVEGAFYLEILSKPLHQFGAQGAAFRFLGGGIVEVLADFL